MVTIDQSDLSGCLWASIHSIIGLLHRENHESYIVQYHIPNRQRKFARQKNKPSSHLRFYFTTPPHQAAQFKAVRSRYYVRTRQYVAIMLTRPTLQPQSYFYPVAAVTACWANQRATSGYNCNL